MLDDLVVVTEQDILGDRLSRPAAQAPAVRALPRRSFGARAKATSSSISTTASAATTGWRRSRSSGAPHDCLRLVYDGGDKLFVPVENIEVLSRYGSEDERGAARPAGRRRLAGAQGAAQAAHRRHGRPADRHRRRARGAARRDDEPAGGPVRRVLRPLPLRRDRRPAAGDRRRASTTSASGKPMDRLVCGDVGFGKTEVALRAAFVAAHVRASRSRWWCRPRCWRASITSTFTERFAGLPVRIGQLSRLVGAKEASETKQALAEGTVDIVVGTHALLAKSVEFKDLGLLIVDEEQHFGVAQKERLKELRADVHVLTLTATPIPRTLQLALTGVRDMSLIATPPVDRLAVRTFVTPFDPVIVREAILREQYRGGQSFYVCPRIEDLAEVARASCASWCRRSAWPWRTAACRRRPSRTTMQAFFDGKFDMLLSTNIVESGLDIRNANTMIIHRADMFGLAQLYQLRGRIGRAKTRAYAYLTVPPGKALSEAAAKRLEVMQTLDTLGAGFQLASHDLDIRGAGNLLGEEQSGHIREVGIELYQQMLEEAVAAARAAGAARPRAGRAGRRRSISACRC